MEDDLHGRRPLSKMTSMEDQPKNISKTDCIKIVETEDKTACITIVEMEDERY